MTLNSASYSDRNASLAALQQHEDEDLAANGARLQAELTERRAARDRTIAEAHATAAATALELEIELAAEAVARLAELALAFPDRPRTTAGDIAQTWRELDARCAASLGAPLAIRHLSAAFAAAHSLSLQIASAHYHVYNGTTGAEKIAKAVAIILSGAAPVVVEHALRDAEIAIAEKAPGFTPASPARLASVLGRATDAAIRVACEEVDEAARPTEGGDNGAAEIAAAYDERMWRAVAEARDEERLQPRVDLHLFGEP